LSYKKKISYFLGFTVQGSIYWKLPSPLLGGGGGGYQLMLFGGKEKGIMGKEKGIMGKEK
jgi:hypothetical protein